MAESSKRMDRAEVRMNARMDRAETRMDRAWARMDLATKKLVEAGMKIVIKQAQSQSADRKNSDYKINALIEAQDRLVRRLLHHRPNGRG